MSDMGTRSMGSLLPEDIEARLANVQETISGLERQMITLQSEVNHKQEERDVVENNLKVALIELDKIVAETNSKKSELADRETKITQKESALNVYANALEEKEKKINKYLAIFENAKDILGK